MFIIYFVLFLITHAVWSLPTELKECEYCHNNTARCTVGHELKNNCVRCRCSEERIYQCKPVSPPCNEEEENIILGKPTQARCIPNMVYEQESMICMCSKGGYWPHEKCEVTFKTLYNPENLQSSESDESSSFPEKCKPDSYIIQDCNVCRCNANGVIGRCTQNDCSKKVIIRRTYDNVQGSCIPHNWYSLAPCQFCHCQQSNKLVCSTRYKDDRSLKLGAYNLTDCGRDLVKELYELAPEGPANLLREGAIALTKPPETTTTTTKAPLTKRKPLPPGHPRTAINKKTRPYDANLELSFNLKNPPEVSTSPAPAVEYESEEETEALRDGDQTTLGLFESDEDSAEEKRPSSYVRLPDGSYKPIYEDKGRASLKIPIPAPAHQNSLQEELIAKGLPKEMVQVLTSIPEVSRIQTVDIGSEPQENLQNYDVSIKSVGQNQPHVLRINLPSVLDSIIKMALRKSMVKIDNSRSCMPGTTTQEGCNFCYCLTNGKLLCTDKKTC